jgi:DNA-nicking Smr family endonuclease
MSRKPIDLQDFELWTEVTRGVRPLHRHPLKKRSPVASPEALAVSRLRPSTAIPPPALVHNTPQKRNAPPPLSAFDRRTAQRLQRGQAEIQLRIDLHGSGVEVARARLHDFILRARSTGARLVLVITGKGASPFSSHTLHGRDLFHSPEREGKLRRYVPEWLEEPEFRRHVIGYQPAHPRHGGGGALYVRLRRSGSLES